MTTVFAVAATITTAAALVAIAALVRREHLADRLLALEVSIVATGGTVATIPALGGSERFVDLALVLGLVGFTSTLAAARYLEHHDGDDP